MKDKAEGRRQKTEDRKNSFIIYFLLLTSYFLLLTSACSRQERIYKESRIAMDTITTISVVSPSHEKAREAIDAGFAEIKRLEILLNYFSPDSEVTAINKAAGVRPVMVSKETLEIVKKSVDISKATNGAFNPAIGPVIKLWKFSRQDSNHAVPLRKEVEKRLRLIDYKKVKVNSLSSEIYLEEKGMEIDLGGIAKGYAADKAIEKLKAKGIKSALVAIAGDIKGFGLRPDKEPWRVGIQDPRPEGDAPEARRDEVFATLYIEDSAISTSGDYQRFFMKGEKRYHHIIDPKTGYPAESSVISVSVIAPEGFMADGLSTAVFVLEPAQGVALLESLSVEGVIVDSDKRCYITKGLRGKIDIIHKGYSLAE